MPRSKEEIQADIKAAKEEIATRKIDVFDILEKMEFLKAEFAKADKARQIILTDITAARKKVEACEAELKEL